MEQSSILSAKFDCPVVRLRQSSDEELTLEMSANIHFTAFSISTSTLRRYTAVCFTTTPTQTKTSSHKD